MITSAPCPRVALTAGLAMAIVVSAVAWAGHREARGATAQTITVSAGDNFYDPASVTIDAGGTVTWVNDGLSLHTVTSSTGAFDSGFNLSPGASFSFQFSTPGAYGYSCLVHGTIQSGTVIVNGETPAPPTNPPVTNSPTDPPSQPPTMPPTVIPTEPPTAEATPTPKPAEPTASHMATPRVTGTPRRPLTPAPSSSTSAPLAEDESGGGTSTLVFVAVGFIVMAVAVAGAYAYLAPGRTRK